MSIKNRNGPTCESQVGRLQEYQGSKPVFADGRTVCKIVVRPDGALFRPADEGEAVTGRDALGVGPLLAQTLHVPVRGRVGKALSRQVPWSVADRLAITIATGTNVVATEVAVLTTRRTAMGARGVRAPPTSTSVLLDFLDGAVRLCVIGRIPRRGSTATKNGGNGDERQ